MRLNLAMLLVIALMATCMASSFVRSTNAYGQEEEAPSSISDGTAAEPAEMETPAPIAKDSARARFRLPKLFDFSRFKGMFKKTYKSVVEEMARQKIFLGNAFKAFVSYVGYKYGRLSSYRSVNQMSDWTPEDIERSRVSVDQLRSQLLPKSVLDRSEFHNESGEDLDDQQSSLIEGQLPAANLADTEMALKEVERHRDEPGYHEIAQELELIDNLETMAGLRSKRNVDGTSNERRRQRLLSADDLMREPTVQQSPEVRRKILHRIASNNPSREQPEFVSYGSEDGSEKGPKPMSEEIASFINNLPGASYLSSVLSSASQLFQTLGSSDQQEEADAAQGDNLKDIDHLPDEIFVDHRTMNCFFAPRDQGQCGSCYAFATIAMYEYLFCLNNHHLVAFSEQYMIDCGRQFYGMTGCRGATLGDSTKFVEQYGLELRLDYPYLEKEDQCAYEPSAKPEQMGYIKLAEKGMRYLNLTDIEMNIREMPILFGMLLGPGFRHYGGGVDDNAGCDGYHVEGHSVLIVGAGREDGKEYYLMRNSYGTSWGQEGCYKMNKAALAKCAFADPVGIVPLGHFGHPDGQEINPSYTGKSKPIQRISTKRSCRNKTPTAMR